MNMFMFLLLIGIFTNQIRSNEAAKLVFAWCLTLAMHWGMGGTNKPTKLITNRDVRLKTYIVLWGQ